MEPILTLRKLTFSLVALGLGITQASAYRVDLANRAYHMDRTPLPSASPEPVPIVTINPIGINSHSPRDPQPQLTPSEVRLELQDMIEEVEVDKDEEEEDQRDDGLDLRSPVLINVPLRVPTCIRKAGKLHTQRKWSVSYDWDNYYNGMHCGLSVKSALKEFKLCRPMTDWTCVSSGEEGHGGVTVEFHTPRTCDDKRIHEAILKGTGGHVDVWCKHQ